MKKFITTLLFTLIILAGCTKIDDTPIEVVKVERGQDYIEITFEVKRDVDLSIRPEGLLPKYEKYSKGTYGYLGERRRTVFDYKFGKVYVEK